MSKKYIRRYRVKSTIASKNIPVQSESEPHKPAYPGGPLQGEAYVKQAALDLVEFFLDRGESGTVEVGGLHPNEKIFKIAVTVRPDTEHFFKKANEGDDYE